MSIDIDKLDKTKTYVVLEWGTSKISKLIDRFTREFFPSASFRPSHVLALIYNRGWWIYESHLKPEPKYKIPSGTRKYRWKVFEKVFPKIIYSTGAVYPLELDVKQLENNLGLPYGVKDIIEFVEVVLSPHYDQMNRKGMVCSEYIATGCTAIREYFKSAPYKITPAHFFKYFIENKIHPV